MISHQPQQTSNNQHHQLKKGWLYKKGFINYKPKFAIFSTSPKPNLQIYDTRDSVRPKYQIYTDAISVTVPSQQTSSWLPISFSPTFDFVLETRTRKFYLRTQSAKERDEWVDILRNFSRFLEETDLRNIDTEDCDAKSVVSYWSDRRSVYAADSVGRHSRASFFMSRPLSQSGKSSLAQSVRSSLGLANIENDVLISDFSMDDYPQIPYLSDVLSAQRVQELLADVYATPENSTKLTNTNWNGVYQSSTGLERARVVGEFMSTVEEALKNIVDNSLSIPQVFQHGSILFHVGGKKGNLELKSINAINAHLSKERIKVSTSLVCCTSYRGVSIIACPMLPLSDATRTTNREIKEKLADIGRPDGIEIHSVDGDYYCVNTFNLLMRDDAWNDHHFRYRYELIRDDAKTNLKEALNNALVTFARKCDNLEFTPVDSRGFTFQLHKHGINARYLGKLCELVTVPFMKDICRIEMISRTVKAMVNEKIAKTIERYKDIEALNIINDLKSVCLKLINSVLEGSAKMFQTVSALIEAKFRYSISQDEFFSLHKQSLLTAICYHSGLKIVVSEELKLPIDKGMFEEFTFKSKVPLIPETIQFQTQIHKLGYTAAKQLLILGYKNQSSRNELSAMKLLPIARYFHEQGEIDKAAFMCNLAFRLAPFDHPCSQVIRCNFVEFEPKSSQAEVFRQFERCYQGFVNLLGPNHPILMTAYDKAVLKLCSMGMDDVAFEFLSKSLALSTRILGVSHPVTAGYKTKAGYMLMALHKYKEALGLFKESLFQFRQMNKNSSKQSHREAIAENLYCIAECLFECGLVSEAVSCSQESKQIREHLYGQMHAKTVDSCQQYARLLSLPLAEYKGEVLTERMKKDLQTAIVCYERVFRYMKQAKADTSVLLEMTRTLVGLRLRMCSPQQRELVRQLKGRNVVFSEGTMKDCVVRLVHLTPSVYLQEVFQRLGDDDEMAREELGAILQLCDNSQQISINK